MDDCILKRQMEDISNKKEYLDDTRGYAESSREKESRENTYVLKLAVTM